MDVKKALLIFPEFSPCSFWNYKEVCRLVGARYPAAPLGMITLAALLPDTWNLKLVDMNTTELCDSDIDEADLVFVGGMLPQQANFIRLIDRIHGRGKKVVAGGPDPTSQPEIYEKSDFLVLGEVENSISSFLKDLKAGAESGVYPPDEERPDIKRSPIPRFELLDLDAYLMIGIQVTRGCPFNCEFCDIIELYGRVPRIKSPEQIVAELDALYHLGYRGHIDFVDDNFIGNRKKIKEILRAVREWSSAHKYPFFFSTEASINIADDEELLEMMRDVDFRYVFIGIESSDEKVLASTRKSPNLHRSVIDDLYMIYRYGIVVNGGFIIGFDNETSEAARSIVETIHQGSICMAMIGLLYALPKTQLTRRLAKEGRITENVNRIDQNDKSIIDQTTSGLNFITKRDRTEIYEDFEFVLKNAYAPKSYFDRCMKLCRVLERRAKHKLCWSAKWKAAQAFIRLVLKLGLKPSTAYYFWRNILLLLFVKPSSVEEVANLMAMYIHFRKHTANTLKLVDVASRIPLEKPCEKKEDEEAGIPTLGYR